MPFVRQSEIADGHIGTKRHFDDLGLQGVSFLGHIWRFTRFSFVICPSVGPFNSVPWLLDILADAGYRGHPTPISHKVRILTSGQKRRMSLRHQA